MSFSVIYRPAASIGPHIQSSFSQVAAVLLGSLVLACAAQCKIPLGPVPFTLQTFAAYALGFFLARGLAVYAVLVYLLEGVAGLPWFAAASSGVSSVLGPTGGYLLGLLWSAYASQKIMAARSRGIFRQSIYLLLLPLPQLLFGAAWLSAYLGISAAFLCGFWMFVPIEWAKVGLSYLMCSRWRKA